MNTSNSNGGETYPRLLLSSVYGVTAEQALFRDLQLKGTLSSGSQVEGSGREGGRDIALRGGHLPAGIQSPNIGKGSISKGQLLVPGHQASGPAVVLEWLRVRAPKWLRLKATARHNGAQFEE